jgi:alpha-tubulin suppressor-like RCC1 family protein
MVKVMLRLPGARASGAVNARGRSLAGAARVAGVAAILAACSDGARSTDWIVQMPAGVSAVRAVTVQVRTGSCTGAVVFETSVTVSGTTPMGGGMPPVLAKGTYYLSASATSADCTVVASGCASVALPVDSGPVTLALTAASGPSLCGPGTTCDGNGRCVGVGVDMGPDTDMGRPDIPELDLGPLDMCVGEGTPCMAAGGGMGTCRASRCCLGCWDGTACRGGNTNDACGARGAMCAMCSGSQTCTSAMCVSGPPPAPGIFSLGTLNSFLVLPDGRWYGAGDDMFVQRGQPRMAVTPEGSFEPFTGTLAVQEIASATTTTCAIERGTNNLHCWGTNAYGSLGIGMAAVVNRPMPTRVGSDRWRTVSAGPEHFCGITTAGALLCWGRNAEGRAGTGTMTNVLSPAPVMGGGTWTAVSGGDQFTCAIRTDGALFCWGGNDAGQLGLGSTMGSLTPQRVGSQTWKSLSAGVTHVCAIRSDDTLWCWGDHTTGRLGIDGLTADVTAPMQVPTPSGGVAWAAVAAGQFHTCGLVRLSTSATTFDLYCWGSNVRGQCGVGEGFSQVNTPTRVSAGWRSVSTGWEHTCGVQDDGAGGSSYLCWGDNEAAALGIGTTLRESRYDPTPIMPATL